MKVIGIVGGVASGKSLVTEQLSELGAVVIDADRIGHDVLRENIVKQSIRETWGNSVFDSSGEVDRARLGQIVFDPDHPGALQELERISHPLIETRLVERLSQLRRECEDSRKDDRSNREMVVILDAPIMVKTGWHRLCDEIIFVDATYEQRLDRARDRGWTEEMLQQRESQQATIRDKESVSTKRVDNNRSVAETRDQVTRLWAQLTQ